MPREIKTMTHQILNEETGELEYKEYAERANTSKLHGGFTLVYYKNYHEVMEKTLNSGKDIKLFNWITNRFTYKQTEVLLTAGQYKDCSETSFKRLLSKLVKHKYIMKRGNGVYRLNPFIYLPYRADGVELQEEWKALT